MQTYVETDTNTAYDTDFFQWTQGQAHLLRQGFFSKVDVIHLAEEIEDMGKHSARALGSYLEVILVHLLKWRYQPTHRSNSWRNSMGYARDTVERILEDSPSLLPKLPEKVPAEYRRACRTASRETGLPLMTFPEQCPFTVEEILGEYWPV